MARPPSDDPVDRLLSRSLRSSATAGDVCPNADLLAAFLDGGLHGHERASVEAHLAGCGRCVQIVATAVSAEPALPASEVAPWWKLAWWQWATPLAAVSVALGVWLITRPTVEYQGDLASAPSNQSAQVPSEGIGEPPSAAGGGESGDQQRQSQQPLAPPSAREEARSKEVAKKSEEARPADIAPQVESTRARSARLDEVPSAQDEALRRNALEAAPQVAAPQDAAPRTAAREGAAPGFTAQQRAAPPAAASSPAPPLPPAGGAAAPDTLPSAATAPSAQAAAVPDPAARSQSVDQLFQPETARQADNANAAGAQAESGGAGRGGSGGARGAGRGGRAGGVAAIAAAPLVVRVSDLVLWRATGLRIERSLDNGSAWTLDYTAPAPIRGGAALSADIAWFFADDGLVIRRSADGWFTARTPGNAPISAIVPSTALVALVRLVDGREITTQDGGGSWR